VTALHAAFLTHDIGTADLALEIPNVMRVTDICGLTQVLTNLTEHGLLGHLLMDGNTTRHLVGYWLAELANLSFRSFGKRPSILLIY